MNYAPGFSSGIIDMQVRTPPDIEAKIGSPHGHIFWAPGAPSPALTMRVFRACPVLDSRLLCS
jgi:hypothetical protein